MEIEPDLNKRILRAKELLATIKHAAMATVNADGSPHNTPYLFMHDPELKYLFWGSDTRSLHSVNVLRTGQIFVVLYDALQRGGLYIKAQNGRTLSGKELDKALAIHNTIRAKENKDPLDAEYYSTTPTRKMWAAEITNLWVNTAERDSLGRVIRDGRIEITRADLLE